MALYRIDRRGQNLHLIVKMSEISKALGSNKGRVEMQRAVTDAGRKARTRVQRAVRDQMGLKPGNYQSYVVQGTRGIPRRERLSFEIFGVKGGARVEQYKGLMSIKRGGRASKRMNAGRAASDQGTVRSAVWNNPRIFKRSFEGNGGFFAMRPPRAGTLTRAPKALWTYGLKPGQPRGADGRFGPSGVRYGKVRRLFGPSLMKEIPVGKSRAVFMREAPILLEQAVKKRMAKLMRF